MGNDQMQMVPEGLTFGDYRVVRLLERDLTGTLYEASAMATGQYVIIKEYSPAITATMRFKEWFEAIAGGALMTVHPAIQRVLEAEQQGNRFYLVLEHLVGETLSQRLQGLAGAALIDRFALVRLFVPPIAAALDAIHQQGRSHGALTPSTIWFAEDGRVLLREVHRPTLGPVAPFYRAPEQIESKLPAEPAVDQYALATIVYEALVGRRPLRAATPAVLARLLQTRPVPLPSWSIGAFPTAVEAVLIQALAKEPAARYEQVGVFAEVLVRALDQSSRSAPILASTQVVGATPPLRIAARSTNAGRVAGQATMAADRLVAVLPATSRTRSDADPPIELRPVSNGQGPLGDRVVTITPAPTQTGTVTTLQSIATAPPVTLGNQSQATSLAPQPGPLSQSMDRLILAPGRSAGAPSVRDTTASLPPRRAAVAAPSLDDDDDDDEQPPWRHTLLVALEVAAIVGLFIGATVVISRLTGFDPVSLLPSGLVPGRSVESRVVPTATIDPVPTQVVTTATAVVPRGQFGGEWYLNSGRLRLTQEGDRVSGSFEQALTNQPGTIAGQVVGQTMNGTWTTGPSTQAIRLTLSPGGTTVEGFVVDQGQRLVWCGAKADQAFAEGCSFAGSWVSSVANRPDCPMTLTRINQQITGRFCLGTLEGSIGQNRPGGQQVVLEGTWFVTGQQPGRFTFLLDAPEQQQFRGNWQGQTPNPWCGWRPQSTAPIPCLGE